jgi:uncharacterized repeat protein (TIGR01451 family)
VKTFLLEQIEVGRSTSLTFTLTNNDPVAALSGLAFTDTLPAGLVVATPNNLIGSCGGGTITAPAVSGSISLAGAALAAGASCTFSVDVMAGLLGSQLNTTSTVASNEAPAGAAASTSINVVPAPVRSTHSTAVPTMSDGALGVLALLVGVTGFALSGRRSRRR